MLRRVFVIVVLLVGLLPFAPGADAQRPDAPRYGERGPYPVGTQEVTVPQPGRELQATIWYPALNPANEDQQVEYRYGLLLLDGKALRDAAPDAANGPYPLIVFSHGSGGFRLQSVYLMEHLASYGFVVISAEHPGNTLADSLLGHDEVSGIVENYAYRPLDVLAEIDYMAGAESPLPGVVDAQNAAVMGHSFGGHTALTAAGAQMDFGALRDWCADPTYSTVAPSSPEPDAMRPRQRVAVKELVCFLQGRDTEIASLRGLDGTPDGLWPPTTDPRIKAVVALAPWNAPILGAAGLAKVTIPSMIMVGSADSTTYPPRDAYTAFTDVSSAEKHLVVFENAEHLLFANACTPMMERSYFDSCSDAVWDMDRAHDLIDHMAAAFLLATFYDDADAAAALQPDAVDFTGVVYLTGEAG
jgi:predicted dienelactone hydrolase